jgi:dipeptidase E
MSRRIVAVGGGGFGSDPDNPKLDDYLLSQVDSDSPRICFIPTASGDNQEYVVKFYDAFASGRATPSHLALFRRRVVDIETFLLSQDIIYVGGGNTVNMLAAWRAHGVDQALRKAWDAGVLLCGLSAGSLCWYESGVTDSFGRDLQPITNCLGFVKGSHCPHYDGEVRRQPTYTTLIAEGKLPAGIALDDGVAAKYLDGEVEEIVSSKPSGRAFWVESTADGAVEKPLPLRQL